MIVTRFSFFTENFVVSGFLSHHDFSALGTTVLARLLQEALVIFVFTQIFQLGFFGQCVKTLCLHEPSSTFARGSIGIS